MNIAYLRVSTDEQELKNQKFEILNYCDHHKMKVDSWINVEVSSRKSKKDRKLKELDNLKAGDILIVSELSRLGRSVLEVVGMVEDLLRREIEFIFNSEN
ncbi:MAG: recombinase family protein, partial [Desulfobulbaceae bacterium]|nr:recombinase family protein [Desulfobulbaceae bacterium]